MASIFEQPTAYLFSLQISALIVYRDILVWQIFMWILAALVVYNKKTSPFIYNMFVTYEVGPIIHFTSNPNVPFKYLPGILLWLPCSFAVSRLLVESRISRQFVASLVATLLRFNFCIGTFLFRITYYLIFFTILQLPSLFT